MIPLTLQSREVVKEIKKAFETSTFDLMIIYHTIRRTINTHMSTDCNRGLYKLLTRIAGVPVGRKKNGSPQQKSTMLIQQQYGSTTSSDDQHKYNTQQKNKKRERTARKTTVNDKVLGKNKPGASYLVLGIVPTLLRVCERTQNPSKRENQHTCLTQPPTNHPARSTKPPL